MMHEMHHLAALMKLCYLLLIIMRVFVEQQGITYLCKNYISTYIIDLNYYLDMIDITSTRLPLASNLLR